MSLDEQIEETRKKLDNLILLKQNENFINKYIIDNLDKISNLKIDINCQQLDNEPEYHCNFTYTMNISYDFKESNNKVINVNFYVEYQHSQTYENRYDPDIYCQTKLKVKNLNDPNDNIYYNYIENESIEIEEANEEDDDEDEKIHWNFIIKKLLEEVEGEKDEWINIIESIDSK